MSFRFINPCPCLIIMRIDENIAAPLCLSVAAVCQRLRRTQWRHLLRVESLLSPLSTVVEIAKDASSALLVTLARTYDCCDRRAEYERQNMLSPADCSHYNHPFFTGVELFNEVAAHAKYPVQKFWTNRTTVRTPTPRRHSTWSRTQPSRLAIPLSIRLCSWIHRVKAATLRCAQSYVPTMRHPGNSIGKKITHHPSFDALLLLLSSRTRRVALVCSMVQQC
jgi:hypothetical protein